MYNRVKTSKEIQAIRESGRMLSAVLEKVISHTEEGVSGLELDDIANQELKKLGGKPAFLGYQGFPNSICISVNDAVVHGIPNDVQFKSGDVIGFDFGVTYSGMITDAARTIIVGKPKDSQTLELVKNTKKSLDKAISKIKPGAKTGDIGNAVQQELEAGKYGIVRELVGHGVGHELHEEPEIPNYGFSGSGKTLKEGMTIAVEPMATLGEWRVVVDPDGWTIRTRDGSLSAHFEDSILITSDGCEILTR